MYAYGVMENAPPGSFLSSASRSDVFRRWSSTSVNTLVSLVAAFAMSRYGRAPPQPTLARPISAAGKITGHCGRRCVSIVALFSVVQVVFYGTQETDSPGAFYPCP